LLDESVGSSILRVILISVISIEVSVASEVGAATVALPAGVVMSFLHSNGYVHDFSTNDITNELKALFFVHPASFKIWCAFPHVLMIDATYKTNKYNMPFVEIVGVTSTGKTFCIAFVFISEEKMDNYKWVLLRGFVSNKALDMILEELHRLKDLELKYSACSCQLRKSCGLSCACELLAYLNSGEAIPLDSVDIFWRTLDVSWSTPLEHEDIQCLQDVRGDGNCGFRSVAVALGLSEDQWPQIRWKGCGIGEFQFTYLGLPIRENMSWVNAWITVVEKFKERLADWKAKTISFEDANPIRTLGDYSRPSHEGYRNTIELPEGNNVVPLQSDTIQLVQNGCSFHKLRFEDPNQHLKDFLKLVDLLDLNCDNREKARRLF
nr:hypothetical protein [Tanacetum cinerariifolium]